VYNVHTGVEGGKFNPPQKASTYHAAESPLFSDEEGQMNDITFNSMTETSQKHVQAKEIPSSTGAYDAASTWVCFRLESCVWKCLHVCILCL